MDAIDILKASDIFSHLSKTALWEIASLTQKKHYAAGEHLVHEGDVPDFFFLIVSGCIQVYRDKNLPEKVILNEVGAGAILGELATIDGLPRTASMLALEPTDALLISAWDFKAQLQAYPEIAIQLLPVIVSRLRQMQDLLITLAK